jgi:translation initiation factor IF-1
MSKEEMLEMSGLVREVLPDSRYRVTLDLELSPYDMTKGRITFRHIEGKGPTGPRKRRF